MSACTFFGHHDCPASIKPILREVLAGLIEKDGVDMFYVGRQGQYDAIVRSVLKELADTYPHINYAVVLERIPSQGNGYDAQNYSDTMLHEGIENINPRFAIPWRNKWMLKQAEYVVAYIKYSWGGAARYVEMAEKQKKKLIKIEE